MSVEHCATPAYELICPFMDYAIENLLDSPLHMLEIIPAHLDE